MIPELLEAARGALNSQLVGGGLVLMLSGAAMALLRDVPRRCWDFLYRQFVVSVDITDSDSVFTHVAAWLDSQPYSQRTRRLTASTTWIGEHERLLFTPAPGNHWFFYKRRLVWLKRSRERNKQGSGKARFEDLTLHTFGRKQTLLRELVEEAHRRARRPEGEVQVFVHVSGDWRQATAVIPRPLSSIACPNGEVEALAQDLREFMATKAWYVERGIPWRRGYLLHGPPGTGKTSTIGALAGALGFDLYLINLASGLSDEELMAALLNVPLQAAVLLEDIDALLDGREIVGAKGSLKGVVTFSGLLNALDGVASRPGLKLFMTTNHPERLDPALTRPGRVDVTVAYGYATPAQVAQLVRQFYALEPGAPEAALFAARFLAGGAARTPAEVQQHLLQHKASVEAALAALEPEVAVCE